MPTSVHFCYIWTSLPSVGSHLPSIADSTGRGYADFLADVFFKQWTTGMAVGAYKEEGVADNMVMYTSLLQFADASVDSRMVTGIESILVPEVAHLPAGDGLVQEVIGQERSHVQLRWCLTLE